ncbi:MAG: BrnA antitoxin family protein [Terriglobia bacterium]
MSKLTKKQAKEIRALARLKDSEINLQDVPELTRWRRAMVGKFYRPIKKPLTIRIDADVLAWLKSQGKGYQTRLNGLLRAAMERHSSR